ncbi:dihydropyrimidinase [Raphidocelis subcapitata]|uniref:dihydropyrimidinase n=1 Tax=Raphidocelis subcapitata TaxID=307507 RepID=A0A2V0NRU6_9CHLO|nr:dihydropyrimidinase [Raphidocelis subcapitata]|eukprot:GBF89372.1 dihydropyrimidinase [Raphidocelis subcapitata]
MACLPRAAIVIFAACWLGCCSAVARGPQYVLVKGGTVVNHDASFKADVLINGQTIEAVGPNLQAPKGAKVVDAAGKLVMPGGIDPHTHLDMPFMGQVACDDFFSGQAAALAGGTTMHIDFALPVDHDLMEGYKTWQAKAVRGCSDYGFHMAVTSWSDKVAKDMGELTKLGINSFKFFMAYKGALMVTDEELINGFSRCKELGALPQVHAENGDAVAEGQRRVFEAGITGPEGHALSRPAVLEAEATGRAVRLAAWVGVPLYVVHVMSAGAAEEVARARQRGERVIGEPVASGLALNESWMWHEDFSTAAQYVMSPPIRAAEHGAALRAALAGGALQLVATDHAVFNSTQKAVGRHDFRLIPNGVNGIEERMHVVWEEMVNSGLLTPSDFVRVTSAAAAMAFNVYPRKGLLAPGSDADVVVLDPAARHVISARSHHSAIDTNVYEGKAIRGKVVVTVSRGRVVWENGVLDVRPGTSRYVHLPPGGPLFEGLPARDAAAAARPYGAAPVRRGGGGGGGGGGGEGGTAAAAVAAAAAAGGAEKGAAPAEAEFEDEPSREEL